MGTGNGPPPAKGPERKERPQHVAMSWASLISEQKQKAKVPAGRTPSRERVFPLGKMTNNAYAMHLFVHHGPHVGFAA
jgi:hypothetical protein